MKKLLMIPVFMLATLAWAAAQQPGMGQSASPGTMPGAGQPQQSMPPSPDQNGPANDTQPGAQGQMANAPVTEGCLGGSAPNFTMTDSAGTTYKLNIPPNADTTKLAQHVGESIQVQGNVRNSGKSTGSIDVQGIGKGTSQCPASGAAPATPKQ